MIQDSKKAKIGFLGTPSFAETILEGLAHSDFAPAFMITEPDKPAGRGQQLTAPDVKLYARDFAIPYFQPATHQELYDIIAREQPDVCIVAAYGRILKPELLALPPHGFLNVHASLLPRYRGASPIQAALAAGDTETGVTIMQIDAGLDTGPILATKKVSIQPTNTAPELFERLAEVGTELLLEVLPAYLASSLTPTPQPTTGVSVTKQLTKQAGQITGEQSPTQIERNIRAFTPWPGVWADLDGQRIILLAAHLEQDQLVPELVQLAGKKSVDWTTFKRDRAELAQKLERLINR